LHSIARSVRLLPSAVSQVIEYEIINFPDKEFTDYPRFKREGILTCYLPESSKKNAYVNWPESGETDG
jgi:hypothetical protein